MAEKRPTLCVVAGPNGSGKTTTTVQLLNNEWTANSFYINPDNIAQEMFGDWNSPEAVMKAAEHATKLRYECLEQKLDFVFETVFSSAEKLEFLRKAKEAGFFIRLFFKSSAVLAFEFVKRKNSFLNFVKPFGISCNRGRIITQRCREVFCLLREFNYRTFRFFKRTVHSGSL